MVGVEACAEAFCTCAGFATGLVGVIPKQSDVYTALLSCPEHEYVHV